MKYQTVEMTAKGSDTGNTPHRDVKGFKCQLNDDAQDCTLLETIDLRKLSELTDSKKSYLSFYLDKDQLNLENINDDRFILQRSGQIKKVLAGNAKLSRSFMKSLHQVNQMLQNHKFKEHWKKEFTVEGAVFFVDMDELDIYYFFLPRGAPRLMVVDSSPYIKPLAALMEEWEDSLIVFVDENNAAIYHVDFTEIHTEKSFHEDIFHHHKKGGWSQMRFQRIREGALKHFAKEIAEAVDRILMEEQQIDRVVFAGPGHIKKHVPQYLNKGNQKKILDFLDIENEPSLRQLFEMSIPVFNRLEDREEQELVEELKGQILKGGLAAYGIHEVLETTTRGRVELILLPENSQIPGFKCPQCGHLSQVDSKCPLDKTTMEGVELMEELVELAQQMGVRLEFIKKPELLEDFGGVGAFLRF